MNWVDRLPALNATLNAICFVLLLTGWFFIRRKQVDAHKRCMLTAAGLSVLFLISYLTYHVQHGSTPYPGQGWMRKLYFAILISHTTLAVVNLPLVAFTFYRALRGEFERHRRLARWTLPSWLYVSITGVIVYLMLYELQG